MRYAYSFFQYAELSAADFVLLGELMLLSVAVVALLSLLRVVWRFLRAVVRSMANLLSWGFALVAVVFLVVRLFRFFA